MESIQQSSIYKLKKRNEFLIHGLSKLQMGASIASEPFIWLDGNTPYDKIVEALIYALSETKTSLPNPTDWKKSAKDFLGSIGLKKQSDLYKDSIHVSIFKKDGTLFFTPTKNEGSKGFINVSKEKMEVAATASVEEIAIALNEALSKCELL